MNVKEVLAGLVGYLFGGAVLLAGISIGAVFTFGAAWESEKLLPWFSVLALIASGLALFILVPLKNDTVIQAECRSCGNLANTAKGRIARNFRFTCHECTETALYLLGVRRNKHS